MSESTLAKSRRSRSSAVVDLARARFRRRRTMRRSNLQQRVYAAVARRPVRECGTFRSWRITARRSAGGSNGARHARVALFADALGHAEAAQSQQRTGRGTVNRPHGRSTWIVWLINRCGAHSAAAHMLRAYEQHAPQDARAPWWLAIVAVRRLPEASARSRASCGVVAGLRARSGDPPRVAVATRAGVSREFAIGARWNVCVARC